MSSVVGKSKVDIHRIGVDVADRLIRTVQWIEPLDWRSFALRQFTIVGYEEGPVTFQLGVVHLIGWMKMERGEEEMSNIAVQHRDSLHLVQLRDLRQSAQEQTQFEAIMAVARRGLQIPNAVKPITSAAEAGGRQMELSRWSWNYQTTHATLLSRLTVQ